MYTKKTSVKKQKTAQPRTPACWIAAAPSIYALSALATADGYPFFLSGRRAASIQN
jgi:hypothetical protein